jgi:hypothetical protein
MALRLCALRSLSERLGTAGMPDTPVNLRNKVSRGKFTAAFFLAACEVMGADLVRLAEYPNLLD